MTFQFDTNRQVPQSFVIVSAFFLLLLCYHLIFSSYFPNFQDRLGHDYSGLLPALLNGYFWLKTNSIWDVPWFTPAFCGGQPFFADVQTVYYSLAQWLTLWFDPLTSVYLSIIVFAALGFWGMYFLLLRRFLFSVETSFLGATLFMFNGFYAHRMLVGHFGFQGFMLIPLIAFLLVSVTPVETKKSTLSGGYKTLFAGLLIAYWLQSGLASLMIPTALAVLAIACLIELVNWQSFLYRSLGAIVIALALSAAKLVAGFAFMGNFSRVDYLLPGFDGLLIQLKLLFITLFFPTADIENTAFAHLIHMQWTLTHHEWEFGVTFIPLLIMLNYWGIKLWNAVKPNRIKSENKSVTQILSWSILTVILIIPLALNFYTPEWNAILKQTPLIKSSSTLTRWWLIYVPIVIVYTAMAFEKSVNLLTYRKPIIVGSISIIIIMNVIQDRFYYDFQSYNGNYITQAYQKNVPEKFPPAIQAIGVFSDIKVINQQVIARITGNDTLVAGISQLGCYNPSFGYRLENLPFKTLHPGAIFEQTAGYFNLKNPACYVFPDENNCRPGDHFKLSQKLEAERFAHYQPFTFAIPLKQKIANLITQCALGMIVILLGLAVVYYLNQFKNYLADDNK